MSSFLNNYTFLEIIAIIFLAIFLPYLTIITLRCLWNNVLARVVGFGAKWNPGENVWAVITGATDGIGLHYARELAAKGYSLMLISRNFDKLNTVMSQLLADNPECKQIKTLAVDFSCNDIYSKINFELSGLETIDVLVNNVGIIYPYPEFFTKIPELFNETYLNVNMLSVTEMLSLVLPRMERQKRGIIINISAQAGKHPTPLLATYCATKAYMSFLSQALSIEYSSKGIIIQTVTPFQVKTKQMSEMKKFPFLGVTPKQFVSSAIKTVGIERTTSGHWKHKLFDAMHGMLCFYFGRNLVMRLMYFELKLYRDKYCKGHNIIAFTADPDPHLN